MSNTSPNLRFMGQAKGFRGANPSSTLNEVWAISSQELSPIAVKQNELLMALSDKDLPERRQAIWLSQALLEFQDLQPLILPENGPFLKVHYAFLESLAAVRSSVLVALGSHVHAGLAVLRSGLELFVFHYWWQNHANHNANFQDIYAWLCGEKNTPPFRNVVDDVYKDLRLPATASGRTELNEVYRQLCSYAHKPVMEECLVKIRGNNMPEPSLNELVYWLKLFVPTLNLMLDLAIANAPQALFPVDVCRKFGFNGPLGRLFDESNHIPVREALGVERRDTYRAHYGDSESLRALLDRFNARPNLTDAQIMESWPLEPIDDAHLGFEERTFHRETQMKARLRALMVGFTYSNPDLELLKNEDQQ